MVAAVLRCAVGAAGVGEQPLPQPAAAVCASAGQHGADVTPALREQPFLCPLPAAFTGAPAVSKMHVAPVATEGAESRVGSGEPGDPAEDPAVAGGNISIFTVAPRSDTTGNWIAFARAYAHLFAREDPRKRDRASFRFCSGSDR